MTLIKDTLNLKIWKDNKLDTKVRQKILDIVSEFTENLAIQISVLDIYLLGSNASYNYTENSDLDIHIVTNFDMYDCNREILQAYFNSERSVFNKNYNITIKGINVEIYVEDINASTISNGIYSVKKDKWIVFPKKPDSIPEVNISKEIKYYTNKINNIINIINNNNYNIINNNYINLNNINNNYINILNNIINRLYIIRKNSLLVDGEYGKGNLLFKALRANGTLDKLKDCLAEQKSKELTLESLRQDSILDILNKCDENDI